MNNNLKNIAEQAGVSVMTVSNVLKRKEGHYSQETFEKVMKVAEELGYVPNMAAKYLRKGKMGLIALVLPDIMNPYLSELSQFVIEEASRRKYTVILSFTDNDPEILRSIVSGALQLPVDGIMMAPHLLDLSEFRHTVPVVLYGERQQTTVFDNIVLDNIGIARSATKHLISLGRKNIASIGMTSDTALGNMPQQRAEGFIREMESAGLTINSEWMIPVAVPNYHRDHGAEVMEKLLSSKNKPDAVFCFNDLLALGAIKVLIDKGYRVPEDVAVIGVDDIIDSRYYNPSLSTIAIDRREAASLGVNLLLDRINGKRTDSPKYFEPGYSLIPRETTLGKGYQQISDR
ncbi:MAG: LacI family DNA-binding transcriptional regulator [Anaerolineaceae bacterium]|nr:LacI family DNA-binding transcriptional regulator [Anaerolineaceae bacterium]